MLGLGRTGTVRASVTTDSGRRQDIYQSYAAALYGQALLTPDDTALAEQVVCDVIVEECASAPGIDPRDMAILLRAVLLRLATSPVAGEDDRQE